MSQQPVIELVLMKPANGVDDAALLKACDDIMPLRGAGVYRRCAEERRLNGWMLSTGIA
jgi:hypothetical protein